MLSILCIILDIIILARNIIPVESIETEAGGGGAWFEGWEAREVKRLQTLKRLAGGYSL